MSPIVVHGIKDGIDEATEMCTAISRNLDQTPEKSVEYANAKVEIDLAVEHLTKARAHAEAGRQRTVKRGR